MTAGLALVLVGMIFAAIGFVLVAADLHDESLGPCEPGDDAPSDVPNVPEILFHDRSDAL